MNLNKLDLEKFSTIITVTNRLKDYQRLFYAKIAKAIKNDNNIKFNKKNLEKLLNNKNKNIDYELKQLQKTIIEFKNTDLKSFCTFNLINEIIFNESIFDIKLPYSVIAKNNTYLLDLVIYKAFKSKYTIYLYDYIMLKKGLKDTDTYVFTIEEFKKILLLDSDIYVNYASIKTRIITPALNELNRVMDISFNTTTTKNKKINTLIFTINY